MPASLPPSPTRARRRRPFAVLRALLALAALGLAARLGAEEPPRFLIERITVSGARRAATARIVVAESRLSEGKSYDERELRAAVYRIRRLPFLVDADFALGRGSRRGLYVLTITIEPTTPVFLSYDLEGASLERQTGKGHTFRTFDSGSLGVREFVGARGLAFASVDKDLRLFEAGYTQYDPFGRASFLSARVTRQRDGSLLGGTLSGGIALTGSQSLRTDLGWSRLDLPTTQGFSLHGEDWFAGLTWTYDTTDDPLFPTTGVKLAGGASYEQGSTTARPAMLVASERFESGGLSVSAARYWPLTARQSLAVSLGAFGNSSFGAHARGYNAGLEVVHAVDLWGRERARRFGDLRWETALDESVTGSNNPLARNYTAFGLRVGLLFRSKWGVVSLGASGAKGSQ